MKDELRNARRVALVTGAAGALGGAIARGLLEQGHRVALLDSDRASVDALSLKLGSDSLALACDVSDAAQVKRACDEVRKKWGPIDILVNNAGILSNNKIVEPSAEEWRRIHSVNLDGPYLLCRECVP